MLKTIEIIFVLLGLVLAFVSMQLDIPALLPAGLGFFGVAFIALGSDAMINRHIVLGRRRGTKRTYTGMAAVLQGMQFNVMGLVVIAIALLMFSNTDPRSLGQRIAERPGLPLIALGIIFLIQAAVVFIGHQLADHSRWSVILDLVLLRLLPGLILVALGLGAIGLGLFEVGSPEAFDEMGGSLLETIYAVRE